MDKPIIDPENVPTWAAASFVLGLLALGIGMLGLWRINQTVVVTQAEIAALNNRIVAMQKSQAPAVAAAPAAAPAAATEQK